MKGIVLKIEDGCFNDILTIKLDDGRILESRGFDIGLKGVPLVDKGTLVKVEIKWNELAKKEFITKIELV